MFTGVQQCKEIYETILWTEITKLCLGLSYIAKCVKFERSAIMNPLPAVTSLQKGEIGW